MFLKGFQLCLKCPWWCSLSVIPLSLSLSPHCVPSLSTGLFLSLYFPSIAHVYLPPLSVLRPSLTPHFPFCFSLSFLTFVFAGADTRSAVGVHPSSPLPCQDERTRTCLQMRGGSRGGGEGLGRGTGGESSTAVDYRYGSGRGLYKMALQGDKRLH